MCGRWPNRGGTLPARLKTRARAKARARAPRLRQARVQLQIILRHVLRGEAQVEFGPYPAPVQRGESTQCLDGFVLVAYYEARDTIFDHFGHRTVVEGNHR